MSALEAAREIRRLIADGAPPDGWPVVAQHADRLSRLKAGEPVPKCSAIDCVEPGIFKVAAHSLVEPSSTTTFACEGCVEHFAAAAAEWLLGPTTAERADASEAPTVAPDRWP